MAGRVACAGLSLAASWRCCPVCRMWKHCTTDIGGLRCVTRSTGLRRLSIAVPSRARSTTSTTVKRPRVQSSGPTRAPKKPPRRAGCSSPSTTALDILARRSPRWTRSWRRIQTTTASRARAGSSAHSASTPINPSPGGSGRRFRYRMKAGNLFVPVSIRGRPASYIVDTGANFSLMSESEAGRLGLAIHEGGASVTDITGGTMGARTTVVDELQVGATILRHIAFLVVGDDQQPFVDFAPDERGVLGIPVLLALEAFRWTADGAFEIDLPTPRRDRREANVCFDGATPVTEGLLGDRRITMHLDTGAIETRLWPKFAGDFAALLSQSGTAGTKRVTGVGHSVDVESITLPEVRLRIGGFDTVLRPADVLVSQTLPPGSGTTATSAWNSARPGSSWRDRLPIDDFLASGRRAVVSSESRQRSKIARHTRPR